MIWCALCSLHPREDFRYPEHIRKWYRKFFRDPWRQWTTLEKSFGGGSVDLLMSHFMVIWQNSIETPSYSLPLSKDRRYLENIFSKGFRLDWPRFFKLIKSTVNSLSKWRFSTQNFNVPKTSTSCSWEKMGFLWPRYFWEKTTSNNPFQVSNIISGGDYTSGQQLLTEIIKIVKKTHF